MPDDVIVRALAHGSIEIDHLNFGEGGELPEHRIGRVAFERLVTALDELHHLALHQVDAGNDHCGTSLRQRTASVA